MSTWLAIQRRAKLLVGSMVVGIMVACTVCTQATEIGTSQNPVRFATFNASLYRSSSGGLVHDLLLGDAQARTVAEIIQRVRPHVLVINEFDYDAAGEAAMLFNQQYLNVGQNGAEPIEFPYVYINMVNNGVPSGFDLNNNGQMDEPEDALGFGLFEGQYGMVVYSMYPILLDEVRTFQAFLWKDMPNALLPKYPGTMQDWYSTQELAVLPISNKSHWDIPIQVGGQVVHVLASHPTPPVFDGDEDANGRRNDDEIRLWADYITPGRGDYLRDDAGNTGGLAAGSHFVIMGDQNSDPYDGGSDLEGIWQLLSSSLVNATITPSSEGAVEQASAQGGANQGQSGDPRYDTADFNDSAAGNLRADYVLPSATLSIVDAGVFWPLSSDSLFRLVGTYPFPSSDHRLVWVDIEYHLPTADAGGPYTCVEGATISLDASGSSDPDGVITSFEWDYNNDGNYDDASGVTPSYASTVPGTHTIGLRVTDGGGAVDTTTTSISVLTSEEAIANLGDVIEGFGLPRGTEVSLLAKLEAALSKLEHGNEVAATNALSAFVNAVEAQRGKKLTEEQASLLIAEAQGVIDSIEGWPAPLAQAAMTPAISVFPNPVSDINTAHFVAQGDPVGGIQVEIFELSGKKIFDSGFTAASEFDWHLDTQAGGIAPNGVYLYRVTICGVGGEVIRIEFGKIMVLL